MVIVALVVKNDLSVAVLSPLAKEGGLPRRNDAVLGASEHDDLVDRLEVVLDSHIEAVGVVQLREHPASIQVLAQLIGVTPVLCRADERLCEEIVSTVVHQRLELLWKRPELPAGRFLATKEPA